jgi:hypothetical protein
MLWWSVSTRSARPTRKAVALTAALLAATLGPLAQGPASAEPHAVGSLATALLAAVRDARFGDVVDFGPFEDVCPYAAFCTVPAQPVAHLPNVDVAVIELDADGRAVDAANVLLSRDYPAGVVVPIHRSAPGPAGTFGVDSVRWRAWDIDRYNGGTFSQTDGSQLTVKGWADNPARTSADDIVPGRESAAIEFMAPYPASLFKLIVAFRILRLVDAGKLSLKQKYTYVRTGGSLPDAAAQGEAQMAERPEHGRAPRVTPKPVPGDVETRTIAGWMEPMITVSDNRSARALLKLLQDRDDLPAMHAELRDLGLGTLQVNGTNPTTGGNWLPGRIHMTSLDTARLLWLIEGGAGTLWLRPDGQPVTAAMLSSSSRTYLKSLLDDQGYNEALSTSNFCGAANTRPGIPAGVPSRWVSATDGTVTVDGYPYGHDVRPCNAAAEVVFGHKTGLTFNYGSDAGIVRALPGKGGRHYVISFLSNLGYRYVDPVFAASRSYPCYEPVGAVCYTQRIPAMAKQIDDYLKASI